jgi:hypothetical protein
MTPVAEFNFDTPRLRSVPVGFVLRGGEENAAQPHFPPLLEII